LTTQGDESTNVKSAGTPAIRGHQIVYFWDGGCATHTLPLVGRVTVGRGADCDVRLLDDSVSRRHASIHGGTPPRIEDLGSANGTHLGGQRLAPHAPTPVFPGNLIEMGDTLIILREMHGDERETVQATPALPLDPAMARVYETVGRVAASNLSVLLLGETGVGKGVVAEAIHHRSPRAARPFVRVNCAAIADSLFESELFGHERGAFTGAAHAKPGLLEAADSGTILLDEIGDMPLPAQAKLLHALECNEVLRVGSVKPRPIDVRVVAATNRDLLALVAAERFRQDLFFRIDGVTISIPPLRERATEIRALARAFVEEASARIGRPAPKISDGAMNVLLTYHWPGNVRELRNAMVRAVLLSQGGSIGQEQFQLSTEAAPGRSAAASRRGISSGCGPRTLRARVRELEKQQIVEMLDRCQNNQVETARRLGISRGTLRNRMRELGLLPPRT
jgi:transcriptional regulator with PAS, ATPase and Fis domain